MTLTQFIQENRSDIDSFIRSQVPECNIDNDERELWILNDEGLYNWALSESVDI